MKIVDLALGSVRFNSWNPNEMPRKKYEALKRSIREDGFLAPAGLVRLCEDGIFEVIDGEHRVRAGIEEKGPNFVAPFVETDKDEIRAKLHTLSMNRLRGEHVPMKEALVLADLLKTHSVKDLEMRLGMPREEVEDLIALLGDEAPTMPEEKEPTFEISIFLYPGQHAVYLEALERAMALMPKDDSIAMVGDGQTKTFNQAMKKAIRLIEATNRARALEMICANFLATPDESFQ